MQVTSTSPILSTSSKGNVSALDDKNKKNNSFDVMLQQSKTKENSQTNELLDDLNSVAKTGYTKEELKQIQEKLDELKQKRADAGKTAQTPQEEIKNLKADLQYAVFQVTGKQSDFSEDMLSSFMNSQSNPSNSLLSTATDDKLKLIEELKKS